LATIASLNVVLAANASPLVSGFKAAENAGNSLISKLGGLSAILPGLGGIASVAGLTTLAHSSMESIDTLAKLSDITGIATDKLGGLQYAADLAGVNAEDFSSSIRKMVVGIGQAEAGTGAAAPAFAAMGITMQNLKSETPDVIFSRVAEAISQIKDPASRAADAVAIFGKSGTMLLPTLLEGRDGLKGLVDEFQSFGGAVTRDQAAAVEGANDALRRNQVALSALGNILAVKVSPAIVKFSNVTLHLFNFLGNHIGTIVAIGKGAVEFGAALLGIVVIGPQLVSVAAGVVKAFKAIASAESLAQAFGGPLGIASVIAGIAVAGTAALAINSAFNSIEKSAGSISLAASTQTNSIKQTGEAVAGAVAPTMDLHAELDSLAAQLSQTRSEFGLTNNEIVLMKLFANGASAALIEFAKETQFQQAMADRRKSVEDLIKTLKDQVKILGWTSSQQDEFKASLAGASDAQIEQIRKLHAQKDAFDATAASMKSMTDEAKQIHEAMQSPLEKLLDTVGKLNELFVGGYLSIDDYMRALSSTETDYDHASNPQNQNPTFQSFDPKLMSVGGLMVTPGASIAQKQLDEQIKTNQQLAVIARKPGGATLN
jgi:hypothetical protein